MCAECCCSPLYVCHQYVLYLILELRVRTDCWFLHKSQHFPQEQASTELVTPPPPGTSEEAPLLDCKVSHSSTCLVSTHCCSLCLICHCLEPYSAYKEGDGSFHMYCLIFLLAGIGCTYENSPKTPPNRLTGLFPRDCHLQASKVLLSIKINPYQKPTAEQTYRSIAQAGKTLC